MPNERRRSRYERTRILSARALQIMQGSPSMISIPRGMNDPLYIAKLEWEQGVIPIDIKQAEKIIKEHKEKE
jgi:DNA-directed RNA polymerase subunit K/omega